MARSGKRSSQASTLRIIGGQWRGRKLTFLPTEGLRPTPDRVRETLFNWLAPIVHGGRCLDLFAGSGALGLEALSRGAASCDFVDTTATALRQIEHHLTVLAATSAGHCHGQSADTFLAAAKGSYDIVFMDPPFGQGLLGPCAGALAERDLLARDGLVYIETAVDEALPELPASWSLHREKFAGGVAYRLYRAGPQ